MAIAGNTKPTNGTKTDGKKEAAIVDIKLIIFVNKFLYQDDEIHRIFI